MGLRRSPEPLIDGLRGVFNPDIFLVFPSYDLMVAGVAMAVPAGRRGEVGGFLDEALDGEVEDAELGALWREAGAEAYIRTPAWGRLFLEDVRQSVADGKAVQ
jgi:hypothetical protein